MSIGSPVLSAKAASSQVTAEHSTRSDEHSNSRAESSRGSSVTASDYTPTGFNAAILEEEDTDNNFATRSGPTALRNSLSQDETEVSKHNGYSLPHLCSPPRPIATAAIPRPGAGSGSTSGQVSGTTTPDHNKAIFSKENLKKTMSSIFKKSNATQSFSSDDPEPSSLITANVSDPTVPRDRTPLKSESSVTSQVETRSSSPVPHLTRPNTPPHPEPSTGRIQFDTRVESGEDATTEVFQGRRKSRSLTGFFLRDILHIHTPKISFAPHDEEKPRPQSRHRASSVDTIGSMQRQGQSNLQPGVTAIKEQIWNMPAPAGVGLKARRISQSLPDDFFVPVTELYEKYSDQSKIFGKRGKSLGKGATAHVKLMTSKKSSSDLYAVKEFRPLRKNEDAEEYEKKVKSEFTIAKSAHHPNIVKTFSLCTHNSRWNHVMEFCDQGDLFGLVQKHYLSDQDHLKDRLCLFKQLVQGINYLHHHGIAHRDIKLENLLITKQGQLKITDFGVSEVFSGLHPGIRSAKGECGVAMEEIRLCAPGICGSPPYIAPEVMAKEGDYDPRATDVWAAAIVMISMTANGTLWSEARSGSSAVYDSLVNGWEKWNSKHTGSLAINERDYPYVSFFDRCINPPALRRILLAMLNPNPEMRSSMHDVATNRWLKNVECCQPDLVDDRKADLDKEKNISCGIGPKLIGHHNHLPPAAHHGHRLVRLPGTTDI